MTSRQFFVLMFACLLAAGTMVALYQVLHNLVGLGSAYDTMTEAWTMFGIMFVLNIIFNNDVTRKPRVNRSWLVSLIAAPIASAILAAGFALIMIVVRYFPLVSLPGPPTRSIFATTSQSCWR